MVEKKEGAKMNCLNCGSELVCGWSKPSGGYAPKLQWQNKDGTAHFTRFDGSKYVCPVEQDIEADQKKAERLPEIKKGNPNERSSEQKVIDAIQMVELLWCPALEKAKEVFGLQGVDNIGMTKVTNKDAMILAQVFFKSMVESYLND